MSESKSKIFSFSSEIGEIILNSSPNCADVFVTSGLDGRCFRAHRVVLAAASSVLAGIMDTSCQFCNSETEDNPVLTFADVSGNIIEHFLALCYTGVSLGLKTDFEELELKSFWSDLKLFSDETLVRSQQSNFAIQNLDVDLLDEPMIGFSECEAFKNIFPTEVLKLEDGNTNDIVEHNFEDLMTADLDQLNSQENDFFHPESEQQKLETFPETFFTSNFDSLTPEPVLANRNLSNRKSWKCKTCKRSFKSKPLYLRHSETCGAEVVSTGLQNSANKRGLATRARAFFCQICNTSFKSKSDFRAHVDDAHVGLTDQRLNKCEECGKTFTRKSVLEKHMLKHQGLHDNVESAQDGPVPIPPKVNFLFNLDVEGRYQCLHPDCGNKTYTFLWKNGFQDHWLDKHTTEDEKVYKCRYCSKGFASNGLRNKHIKFSHELKYNCTQCPRKFPTRHTLVSHMRMHTGEKPYVCDLCGADFRNRTNWRQHNDQYHAEVKKHKCDDCGKEFRLRSTLKEHQIGHQLTKQFNVEFPLEIVENEDGKQAMYYVTKTDYPMREEGGRFFCTHDDCREKSLSFQWKNGLREHYMERHALESEKHFGCNFCAKKFGTNALRNKHEKITHLLRFPCVHCDKKFGKRVTLVHHMRLHTGEKPFVCEICGTRFSQKTYLKQHNDLHHPKEEIKKEHKCDICGKCFRLKGQLKHHIKTTHIEGRPFVCEECGKNYKDLGTLKRHKESHSGIRIACEPCNITFPSRANLRRHMKRKHDSKDLMIKPEMLL